VIPQHKFSLQLVPTDSQAWGILVGQQRPMEDATARKIAEGDVVKLKSFFTNYAVRADSWSDLTVSGLKGVSFVADYQDKDRARVEYRTYILTPSLVLWFVFRIEREEFDASRPTFDKVVQSLQAPEWMSGPDAEYLNLCTQAVLATLPPELNVLKFEWHPGPPSSFGRISEWQLNFVFPDDEQRQISALLPGRMQAIQKATIYSEKIPFVIRASMIGSAKLAVVTIGEEEAEKRRASAQHETK
jgi:hypothetical protein